ncbi:MAG TPA: hypothetical protein VN088_14560, partial [Nocardioides sp.]|nr:hypothetical protein [Nocardioides sp.]
DPGWIAVYVIVALLVLGALLAAGRRKKQERDRERAESIRAEARSDEPMLARREAEARRLEAESAQARAEADRREAMARSQREKLDTQRAEYADRMQEADRLDPDVKTGKHSTNNDVDAADGSDASAVRDSERHDVSH